MDTTDSVNLDAVAQGVVSERRAAPCAVLGAARWRQGQWRYGWGAAGTLWWQAPPGARAPGPPASLDTVFDLASLSKPVTALTLARCQGSGRVSREQNLADCLDLARGTRSSEASLSMLSAHRAGLEAHIEFFVKRRGATQALPADIYREAAQARRLECAGEIPPDGFAPVYSDLGYILLGAALESVESASLDSLVAREVCDPLGLRIGSIRSLRARFPNIDDDVAPTECVRWRGGVIRGLVHDENAWVLAGDGSAGHAGLFGDVRSVVALGVAIVDALKGRRDEWLNPQQFRPLIERRPGGTHCAGFDRRSADTPMSGRLFGEETFGHLGFTGTSIWIDPEQQMVGVMLSNRVHPSRESTIIREARPAAYDAMAGFMLNESAGDTADSVRGD